MGKTAPEALAIPHFRFCRRSRRPKPPACRPKAGSWNLRRDLVAPTAASAAWPATRRGRCLPVTCKA